MGKIGTGENGTSLILGWGLRFEVGDFELGWKFSVIPDRHFSVKRYLFILVRYIISFMCNLYEYH